MWNLGDDNLDYTSFFYSIAGCSATIIAIIGGFIASKLISISSDRDTILDKIKEIEDELEMKTRKHNEIVEELNADDALDFIGHNISMLIDNESIDVVYETEERPRLDYSVMKKYWCRALDIFEEMSSLDTDDFSNTNSDKIPAVLANKYTNNFDYKVCKKIIREMDMRRKRNSNLIFPSALLMDSDSPQIRIWYHQKRGEVERLKSRIEELEFEKRQYEEKKKQIRKPKGMKAGLWIFAIFSSLGVFFPLICALINYEKTLYCLCMPAISFILFAGCTLVTFVYLVSLLIWKE